MEIVWTRAADCDLASACDYLGAVSPAAKQRFLRRVFSAVEALSEMPYMGKPTEYEGQKYRALIVEHLKLYYFNESVQIVIVRAWDTRQDPSRFFIPSQAE